eukprot:3023339-Amphidinium_carterae.1
MFGPGSWTIARDPDDLDVLQPRCHHDCVVCLNDYPLCATEGRILLLYARFNPGVRYVQGMNELCAPLYYLFATDPLQGHEALHTMIDGLSRQFHLALIKELSKGNLQSVHSCAG